MSNYSESDSQPFDQIFQNSFQSSSHSTSHFNCSNIHISLEINHNYPQSQYYHTHQSNSQEVVLNLGNIQNQSEDQDSYRSYQMAEEPVIMQSFQEWYIDNHSNRSLSFAEQEFEFQPSVVINIEQDESFERDSPFFPSVHQQGLHIDEIKSIPTMNWSAIHQKFNKGEKCPVCLQQYVIGKVLRVLPCLHRYHVQCLDQWLQMRANCPNCRTEATNL